MLYQLSPHAYLNLCEIDSHPIWQAFCLHRFELKLDTKGGRKKQLEPELLDHRMSPGLHETVGLRTFDRKLEMAV